VLDRIDVLLMPMASSDLIDWSRIGIGAGEDGEQIGNATLRSVRVPSAGLSRLFLRIQAE
jgi:hypothetical protein